MSAHPVSKLRLHQAVFCAVMLIVFGAMAVESLSFRAIAGRFPLYVALIGVLTTAVFLGSTLVRVMLHRRSETPRLAHEAATDTTPAEASSARGAPAEEVPETPPDEDESHATTYLRGFRWYAMIAGLALVTWLAGLLVASMVWVFAWLTYSYRMATGKRIIAVAVVGAVMYALVNWAGIQIPTGILF